MPHIPYKVIRSERKSVSLKIDKDASLIIHAPLKMSEQEIEELVEKHQKWILKKQSKILNNKEIYQDFQLKDDAEFLCLGKKYVIEITEIDAISFYKNKILIPKRYKKSDVLSWMKWEAGRFLKIRTDYYARKIGVQYLSFRISDAKTRWGSCSGKDRLNFSWRLLMCPQEIIDYVVIHELCHIRHKNHSKEFWNEVEKYMPDYAKHRLWLKNNSEIMNLMD